MNSISRNPSWPSFHGERSEFPTKREMRQMRSSDGTPNLLLTPFEGLVEAMSVVEKLFRSTPKEYGPEYQEHVLELYKLYVQSADNISSRRHSANVFFLGVNTAIIAASGYIAAVGGFYFLEGDYSWVLAVAGIVLCIAWYMLVRAYKNLNSAKFKVIHALEEKLPVSLYDAEWELVGRGKNPKLYRPFTDIEVWIPPVFILLHSFAIVYFFPLQDLLY